MHWNKIYLTHAQVADGTYEKISRVLHNLTNSTEISQSVRTKLASFDYPADDSPAEEGGKPDRTIYLSPELSELAKSSLALESCDPPSRDSLEVFTSWDDSAAAWEILRASSRK